MDLDVSDNASWLGAVYHAQHQVRQRRFSDLLSSRFPSLSSTLLTPPVPTTLKYLFLYRPSLRPNAASELKIIISAVFPFA